MSILIAAITTGAGVVTTTPAQTQFESDLVIGDVDTASPLQSLKVNIDGDTTIDIAGSQPLVSVFTKLSNLIAGTVIGLVAKLSTGRIICKAAQLTLTNNGATTPSVYWNSQRSNGRPIRARTTTINPNSPGVFMGQDFAYLAVTNPTNISSIDVTFADGIQQPLTVVEADALFSKYNEAEANGRLDAVVTTFDNTRNQLYQVRITTGATGVTCMMVK